MKRVEIYKREVLERAGCKKHPYKNVAQYIVFYDKREYRINHSIHLNNNKIKIKFLKVFDSRKKEELNDFVKNLKRTEEDLKLKEFIKLIMIGGFKLWG